MQFNDPYTNVYEQALQDQMRLLQDNPQVNQLMDYLNNQFSSLTENPGGYTPDQMAFLRTQAQEPIMAQRDAMQRRSLERTSQRGMLPSSGPSFSEAGNIDREFANMGLAAQRDLAIQGIQQAQANRQEALNLGQASVAIPQAQQQQAVNAASQLYDIPRQAMLDALGIVNASPPAGAANPYLVQQDIDQRNRLQAQNDQNAFMTQIGTWLSNLM
tara:strand:- start:3777 stop:4421 length:645 start_codon:yes stop_codon:yes gene_type:complete